MGQTDTGDGHCGPEKRIFWLARNRENFANFWRGNLVGADGEAQTELAKSNRHHLPLVVYTILSIITRLYRIGKSNTVIWDEAHFGKFGAYYINRTFYFDVHPPLGKMLVGLAEALSGFNGSFDFGSGVTYPSFVPYRAMRFWMALPGIAMVPLAWSTASELKFSRWGRHLVTLMVLCGMQMSFSSRKNMHTETIRIDLAWLVISRFVLLDSLLLCFTFSTVYCLACFHNQQRRCANIDPCQVATGKLIKMHLTDPFLPTGGTG
jgi:dolichyl-phosphate-mannose-protein mannosyltransferase